MRLTSIAATALALSTTPASAVPRGKGDKEVQGAAYILSNNPGASNYLLALGITHDGTISSTAKTETGGQGLLAVNAGPDGLFSQGSVEVKGDLIFTVNPGSNTLSMFRISPFDVLHPQLVGKPVDTLGEFPMSVAYSEALRLVCVLNGGAKGGVACFGVDRFKGLRAQGPLRPLTKGYHETTPPTGPPLSASDIEFNPSSSALFATIKGDPGATPPAPGYIYTWPVRSGAPAQTPIITSFPDVLLDFSLNFLGGDGLALLTDPSFGAAILSVSPKFQITERAHTAIPLQRAACWGAYSARYDSAYVIDASNSNITALDPRTGSIKDTITYDATAGGGLDTAVAGRFLYVATRAAKVAVIDLQRKTNRGIQSFDLTGLGDAKDWQGMGVYLPSEGN